MQALVWILRLFIVLVLVWFAVKNSQEIVINGFPEQQWRAPLIFVLLVVFVGGVVIGLLAWVPTVMRQRRELARLKRAAEQHAAVAGMTPPGAEREPPGADIHGI